MAHELIGMANSKTGVFLKDTGARDEHGMQPLDDIFSSPEKDSHNGADDFDEESDEEPMDIDEGKPDRRIRVIVCDETSKLTRCSDCASTIGLHEWTAPSAPEIAAENQPQVACPQSSRSLILPASGSQRRRIALRREIRAEAARFQEE